MSRLLLRIGVFLTLLAPALSADAYCRMTVEEPMPRDRCPEPGTWLEWRRQCISYTLVEREALRDGDPSFEEIRNVADRSFAHWTAVECDGEPIGLDLRQTADLGMCTEAEYSQRMGNANAIFFVQDWFQRGLPFDAFGLTMIWHNPKNGEIFDADMQINETQGRVAICGARCPTNSVDLENVITHEAGHFLGLGHSEVDGATMAARASIGETEKRSLEADDVAGICHIYGELDAADCDPSDYQPDRGFNPMCVGPEEPLSTTSGGCSVADPQRDPLSAAAWSLGLVLLVLVRRRTRIVA